MKRLLIVLCVVIALAASGFSQVVVRRAIYPAAGGGSFPVNGILDNFNRANESPMAGGWAANPYWFGDTLSKVVSNQSAPVTGGFSDALWNTSFNADQEVYLTLSSVSTLTSITIYCRAINENTSGFTNQWWGATFTIASGALQVRVSDGSTTQLDSQTVGGGSMVDGDAIGFSCVGTTIKTYFKRGAGSWTLVSTVTSSRLNSAGKILFNTDSGGGYIVDNFGGGNS